MAMNGFAVNLDARGPETMIVIAGEVDVGTADDVRAAGLMAVQAPDVSAVAFDLSAVTFMDSTGIGALVDVLTAGRGAGVEVRIAGASDRVDRVLAIAGLAATFGLAEPEALPTRRR